MKLAIHNSNAGFHPRWIAYCEEKGIPYKVVNCYDNDIIQQLQDCDALMWHHTQTHPADILIAMQILFSLQHSGKKVFPDFNTNWHFDDKAGQKYLLEAIGAPLVPSYVFYKRQEALDWVEGTIFPKVWKLRGGAGSQHVRLIKSKQQAKKIIQQAFGKGFSQYHGWSNLQERWRKYRLGLTSLKDVLKGLVRLGYATEFSKVAGKERGYVYFQDFIPGNDSDTRIIVIGNNAFALKRFVRKDDFRASGSGNFKYEREVFDEHCIKIAFEVTKALSAQCMAYDFVFHDNVPMIVEISYGFSPSGYDDCPGYWDESLVWHDGRFNPYGWMVELMISSNQSNLFKK